MKDSDCVLAKLLLDPTDKPKIYSHRIVLFRKILGFGINDVNMDCQYNVDDLYIKMFPDIPVFQEYNYCSTCQKAFTLWNLINIDAENVAQLEDKLKVFFFRVVVVKV